MNRSSPHRSAGGWSTPVSDEASSPESRTDEAATAAIEWPPNLTLVVCGRGRGAGSEAIGDRSTSGGRDDHLAATTLGAIDLLRLRPDQGIETLLVDHPATESDGYRSARASHLLFMPLGVRPLPDLVEDVIEVIWTRPELDLLYFDDLAPTFDGAPTIRPGYSPDRLRAQMYLGQVVMVSRRLTDRVDPDGVRLRAPLAHEWALRLADAADVIGHLPGPRYRRAAEADLPLGPGPVESASAVSNYLTEVGFPATAEPMGERQHFAVVPRPGDERPVSIVMPTMGATARFDDRDVVLAAKALRSVARRSTYSNIQIVVVTTPGSPPNLEERLRSAVTDPEDGTVPAIAFHHDGRPFNFANACNFGAVRAEGDILLFLNDDTGVLTPDWIERLVMYAGRPDIGAVGAKLLHGDGTVQHAGIWTRGGHPEHRYRGLEADSPGYLDALHLPQNCLAVTGAVLAVEAEKFHRVGGFSPVFPSSFNDVDLCLKLADIGCRTVVDCATVLLHAEGSSRDPGITTWEIQAFHRRWRSLLNNDPFDNPIHVADGSEELPTPTGPEAEARSAGLSPSHHARFWPPPTLVGPLDRELYRPLRPTAVSADPAGDGDRSGPRSRELAGRDSPAGTADHRSNKEPLDHARR